MSSQRIPTATRIWIKPAIIHPHRLDIRKIYAILEQCHYLLRVSVKVGNFSTVYRNTTNVKFQLWQDETPKSRHLWQMPSASIVTSTPMDTLFGKDLGSSNPGRLRL